jgi:lysine-N-methylase
MLNPDGLCSLIIEGGDDLLTEICREHPRYYNVYSDYAEMGLGLSCEAAAELILCSESEQLLTVDIREDDTLLEDRGLPAIGSLLEERAKLLELSIDRSLSLPDTFRKMLGLDTVNSKAMSYSSLGKLLSDLEAIDESYPSMITEAALRADRNREEMLDHLSYISENGGRSIIFSELHRHYLDSVYMLDSKERISYAFVFLVSVALLSFGKKSTDELIKATVLTSKNLDYSTENTESILNALSDDTITSGELLYLIGG